MSSFNKTSHPAILNLTDGQSFIVKDYRGFTVFQVDENGDVKRKGRDIKI